MIPQADFVFIYHDPPRRSGIDFEMVGEVTSPADSKFVCFGKEGH